MKITRLLILLAIGFMAIPVSAQKRKATMKKAPKTEKEKESPADRLYHTMLSSTAKVMVIDSAVVNKDQFLSKIPLNQESGTIMRYQDFFQNDQHPQGSAYVNEFRNSCYFSEGDTTHNNHLYATNLLGDKWSEPEKLSGITDDYVHPNYPFLMADGVTLFFAAEGPKSLGGYDIFMTVFDRSSGQYYTPENYGLPFNSKANDYLLAIDDLDTLGWFVSDRYQPEGKVCIYTFVPTNPRQNFDGDNLSEEKLRQYANLIHIRDTWAWGNREKAAEKLQRMLNRRTHKDKAEDIDFIINDAITYHLISEFQSPSARKSFLELMNRKNESANKKKELSLLRDQYEASGTSAKAALEGQILQLERDIEQDLTQQLQQEKEIRNTEITFITK